MSEVTEVYALERQYADAKILVDRRQMAMRLAKNRDFRELILNGFCLTEAARYVQESADPHLSSDLRADALNMAQASGHLRRFLSIAVQMGAHAERTISDLEKELAEARLEEGAA